MDVTSGASVFVIVGSGDEFSTAWGCYGCKISVAKFEERIAKLLKRVAKFEEWMGLLNTKIFRKCKIKGSGLS